MKQDDRMIQAGYEYILSPAVTIGNEKLAFGDFINGAKWYRDNQWIKTEDEYPTEKIIYAKLTKDFCGCSECYETLYWCDQSDLCHPAGYYDNHGENVPTNAIDYWMSIPPIKNEGV